MTQLQQALQALADAMRPDDEHDEHDEQETEREVKNSDVPRPMGYFSERPAGVTTRRAHNADDGPLVPRAVLLAPPTKKGGAK